MSKPVRPVALAAGPVMVIGGAEDKARHKAILTRFTRFARFAGGAEGHVVVISTASSLGDEATQIYRELLTGLGIGRVSGLRPEERAEANDPAVTKLLAEATGVFLTGGNQSRLTQVVGGRKLADGLLLAHDRGAVLAGTSAGASAMASHMVAFGRSGATPKNRMVQLSAGLGVIQNVVIDQHFEQRARTPVRESGGAIVEVNAAPGFRMHTHPTEGEAQFVPMHVVDLLFPAGTPSRIPIVAVTGSNGKTTTVRMIAHIFKGMGRSVGFTTKLEARRSLASPSIFAPEGSGKAAEAGGDPDLLDA